MIWIVYGVIALGIAGALFAQIRRWESGAPPRTANGAPSFGTVFVTVLKVIVALAIILVGLLVAILVIAHFVID